MAGGALLLPALSNNLNGFGNRREHSSVAADILNGRQLDRLGGMTLRELRDYHYDYLMETYVPNWNRGIDRDYGGFANAVHPDREPDFERKGMYHQGRAVWVFSYLYNHITGDERHLEAAVRGRDFLVENALTDDNRWRSFVNRRGEPQSKPLDHYGDIYMVLGLTELYKATDDERDIELAIDTAHSIMDRLVSPSYQHIEAHVTALEPGTRRLPSWQHFLSALTPLLKVRRDPAIEQIALYCVRVMCEHHWQPDSGVLLEVLDDHFRPYTFDVSAWGEVDRSHATISGWHSIQACWMIMDESLRVENPPTYRQGVEMGMSTLEKMYLDGKGLAGLDNPGSKPEPEGSFAWGALDDMLVYCLMAIEHSHNPQAIDYYNRCLALHNSHPEKFVIQGLLHHPRRFFYSIEILDRMIDRDGRISGFFG